MRFIADHDMHIHTTFSPCSSDPNQTPHAILAYGLTNGFKLLSIADHAWDTDVPVTTPVWGPLSEAMKILPLPQSKKCHLLYGIEADINRYDVLGISKENLEMLDFAIISADHLNLTNFTIDPAITGDDAVSRHQRYKERLHTLLDMDLPFYKTSLGHFSDGLVCDNDPINCIALFTDNELRDIFTKMSKKGMGVELNIRIRRYKPDDFKILMRPFFIAKELGCKFTFGGDAHNPEEFFGEKENMEAVIDYMGLEEDDKLPYVREKIAKLDSDVDYLGAKGL